MLLLFCANKVYFYGELEPPYIDLLGRGARLRATNLEGAIYSKYPRCYKNVQPHGSNVSTKLTTISY
jgi:hypothetical protein